MEISACIIAKNEENNLPRLLKSLKGKFDEIILVDTGSTDRTVEIAKEFGCKVYHREWNGFADARNYAVSKASGEWIWHFDADFEIDDEEFKKAKQHLLILDERFNSAEVIIENYNIDGTIRSISSHSFIHRNKPEIRWVGKVHEWIENGEQVFGLNVKVKHFGYEDDNVLIEKAKRNIKLLEDEIEEIEKKGEREELPYKYFYLVQSYSVLGSKDDKFYEKIVQVVEEKYFFIRKQRDRMNIFDIHIYTYFLNALIKLNRMAKAKKYLKEALSLRDDYPDYFYYEGLLFERLQDFDKAFKGFVDFLYYVDKLHGKSPFANYGGLTVLSDKTVHSYNIAIEKVPFLFRENGEPEELKSFLEKKWKDGKGLFVGIAYSKILTISGEESEKVLKKLTRIYNNNYLSWFEYGNYLLSRGENLKAEKTFEKTVRLNPNFLMGKLFFLYAGVLNNKISVNEFIGTVEEIKLKFEKTKNPYFLSVLEKCLEILNVVRAKNF